ncbi:hypothetical protein CYV32_15940 [Carnobacterium maltaromaticum]|nr:hypothetical protein CYV32_15940 [Carnobacterium maltaromaticum]
MNIFQPTGLFWIEFAMIVRVGFYFHNKRTNFAALMRGFHEVYFKRTDLFLTDACFYNGNQVCDDKPF